MTEVWKPVVGYESTHVVSSKGNVRNKKRNSFRKQKIDTFGYLSLNLSKGKTCRTISVHRLMGEAFLCAGPNDIVNHKDGNKKNNVIENLEIVSVRENASHHWNSKRNLPTGVRRMKSGKYSAQIRIENKIVHLGTYGTPEEASGAYNLSLLMIGEENRYAK